MFSIKEIENLLSSTSHYHKLYALRLVKTCLEFNLQQNEQNESYIWDIIMNKDYSNIPIILDLISQTHSRLDFVEIII